MARHDGAMLSVSGLLVAAGLMIKSIVQLRNVPMPFANVSSGGYTNSAGVYTYPGGTVTSTLSPADLPASACSRPGMMLFLPCR